MRLSFKVACVGAALGAAVVFYKAAKTYVYEAREFHPPRGPIVRPEDSAGLEALRDVALTSADGTAIRGWYVPSKNGAAIVFVHGSPGNRREPLAEGRALAQRGFGVMLFDLPGHGDSGGNATWSSPDRAAVAAAIDYVASRAEVDPSRIGMHAFSMGSAIGAQVVARDPRVRAVVLAGAFPNEKDQLLYKNRRWGPVTQLPALWAMRHEGVAVDELRTMDVIGMIAPRPVLFITGTEDQ
jgi:pimeloyl-ACP methyl ester carboxylesterase